MNGWRHSLAVVAATLAIVGWHHMAGAQEEDEPLLQEGRQLYLTGCSSCHGTDGSGVTNEDGEVRGPSLLESGESGEAAAYYYLSTGRMPLTNSAEQPRRKQPAYTDEEIDALVAYVGSLGDGPRLPTVDLEDADLVEGGELFRANCAPCHSAAGAGGALSYGEAAPNLHHPDALEIAAAMRAGPGQMPVFGPDTLSDQEVDDIVAYVRYLEKPDDPGGVPLGRIGPIPEGLVAWLVGMGSLLLAVAWIGTRAPVRRRPR